MEKISDNTDLEIDITGLDMIRSEDDSVVNITGLEMIISDDSVNITGLDSIRQIFQTDMPAVSEFAVELLRLVGNAKELDTELKLFGAEIHKYEFKPIAAISDVRAFENRHNIKLPRAYVEFLTQVGNGGAGPDNGLYSLEELEFHNFYVHSGRTVHYSAVKEEPDYYTLPYKIDDKPVILNSYLTEEKWNIECAQLDALRYAEKNNEYIEKRQEIYNGVIKILDSYDNCNVMLICDGDMCGEIAEMSDDLNVPHYIGKSFEEWLLDYFKDVIRKFSRK